MDKRKRKPIGNQKWTIQRHGKHWAQCTERSETQHRKLKRLEMRTRQKKRGAREM
jgi:hypothetical protein